MLEDFVLWIFTNSTGNSNRFVTVATSSVTEVSQPKANVPPKLLAQKITNPAIKTRDVYNAKTCLLNGISDRFCYIKTILGQYLLVVHEETYGNIYGYSQRYAENQYSGGF